MENIDEKKLDKVLNDYFAEMDRKDTLVKSEDYLSWVDNIMNIHSTIDDESFFYQKEKYTSLDIEYGEFLSYFHSYIRDLASKQKVRSIKNNDDDYDYDDDEIYFCLKNKFYSISTIHGQGSITYLHKIEDFNMNLDYVKVDSEVNQEELKERELIQYVIVNKDLDITKAKFGVHIGHACTIAAIKQGDTSKFKEWYQDSENQKIIILEANESKLLKLEKQFFSVRDSGYTEVVSDTLIAISLGIMTRKEAKPYIKGLQLWKE